MGAVKLPLTPLQGNRFLRRRVTFFSVIMWFFRYDVKEGCYRLNYESFIDKAVWLYINRVVLGFIDSLLPGNPQ